VQAWIGLGSNRGNPARLLEEAIARIEALPETSIRQCSGLYRTKPWGLKDQPDFLNAVACLETSLGPKALLRSLQDIETALGRVREGPRWGPRRLDLDLLCYEDVRLVSAQLTLPHPHMHERAFVLVPLLELAPDLFIPGRGPAAEQLALLTPEERHSVQPVQPQNRSH
jgi:2-amino-4-hydroxy-6-hydroxymethyldihydropteridine diphosphokinase